MAKLSPYVLLIVLLTNVATTIVAATAEAPVTAPSNGQSLTEDSCPFRFNFTSCWLSIAKVEGCATELIKSITSFKVSVSADCCSAITDVSTGCFSIFGGVFAPLLKNHCNATSPNPSIPENLV